MRCTVLFASPRGERSNTLALLGTWLEAWHQAGHEARVFSLYDMDIKPCSACRGCQNDWQRPACVVQDDMQPIFGSVLQSDLLLLATPIYSWFCTPPMKAALDRLVYAMEKYYGPAGRGPSLLAGKALAPSPPAAIARKRARICFWRPWPGGASTDSCAGWAA